MNSLLFNSIYNYLLLYLAIVACIFALNLFFIIFPHTPAKRRYRQARYAIATGLLMVAILSFIHWYFQLRELSSYYSIAITIGVLFPALTLFIMAFTAIISEEEIKSEHMERNFIPVIACIITLWGGGFGNDRVRIVILVIASVVFLVETFTLSLLMRRSLNKRVETQRQHPSVQAFILWLRLPMYWGVVTGVLGIAVMVVSKKIAILLLFNFVIFFCHLFVSILNYAMHFEKNTLAQQAVVLSGRQKRKRKIEEEIQQWIKKKRYMKTQLTLNEVALQLHTNRTYLSQYLNMELNMPFGTWLSQLRLNEAKQMLIDEPSLSITEAAQTCGFSSVSNFSHLFSALEGMTPQQWRVSKKE